MALSLDGHVIGAWNDASSQSVSLTTANANDIIIVQVALKSLYSASPVVSSVTATGLTFTNRTVQNNGESDTNQWVDIEEWWAPATAAFSGSITVNLNVEAGNLLVEAFGVTGANLTSPFDTNASLPAVDFNTAGGTTATTPSYSTTTSNDMLICLEGGYDANGSIPSGFTQIDQSDAPTQLGIISSYNALSGTVSGQTSSYTDGSTNTTPFILIDAIVPASGGGAIATIMPRSCQ